MYIDFGKQIIVSIKLIEWIINISELLFVNIVTLENLSCTCWNDNIDHYHRYPGAVFLQAFSMYKVTRLCIRTLKGTDKFNERTKRAKGI